MNRMQLHLIGHLIICNSNLLILNNFVLKGWFIELIAMKRETINRCGTRVL